MKKIRLIFLYLVIISLFGCGKDHSVEVVTPEISDVTVFTSITKIELSCIVTYRGDFQLFVRYGEEECCLEKEVEAVNDGSMFSASIDDLDGGHTYYYRFVVRNQVGEYEFEPGQVVTNSIDVFTKPATYITFSSADCEVTVNTVSDDDEYEESGLCWSEQPSPIVSDHHVVSNSSSAGTFLLRMDGLEAGKTYYARAYVIKDGQVTYGDEVSFTTFVLPVGAISGVYSVSDRQKICFSQGNLQFKATERAWRFATNQYDYVGDNNVHISNIYSGWIDLFGWGTSGINHGAICYQPWSVNQQYMDYYAYGNDAFGLYSNDGSADWGANPISNGGNVAKQWRSLTKDKWVYLFNTRTTYSGNRFVKAQVNGVNGVMLLPDNWIPSSYELKDYNNNSSSFSSNIIPISDWENLQRLGVVFLPAAGSRDGLDVHSVGSSGYYWSSSSYDAFYASFVSFQNGSLSPLSRDYRYYGQSVRLVQVVE